MWQRHVACARFEGRVGQQATASRGGGQLFTRLADVTERALGGAQQKLHTARAELGVRREQRRRRHRRERVARLRRPSGALEQPREQEAMPVELARRRRSFRERGAHQISRCAKVAGFLLQARGLVTRVRQQRTKAFERQRLGRRCGGGRAARGAPTTEILAGAWLAALLTGFWDAHE